MGMFFALMHDDVVVPFRLPSASASVASDETMTITKFCKRRCAAQRKSASGRAAMLRM
jgi:hypothetical protein